MACTQQRVLVVEDDDGMRAAIVRLLKAAGFAPDAYASAEALLAAESAGGAACVVSDLRLPERSGLELLGALRGRGWDLPMILITAHDAPGLREEAARRGVADYLPKPFRGTDLLAAIAHIVTPSQVAITGDPGAKPPPPDRDRRLPGR
jgi:two-component system response regulator FixJ